MANPVDSRKIRREIARKYESDPKNWRLFWSIDKKGYNDLLVAKDSDIWWLKEAQINPLLSVGCGVKRYIEEDLMNRVFDQKGFTYPFGLRPITDDHMKKIISALTAGENPHTPILEVLRSEPKPFKEIETSFLMQGPFQHIRTLNDLLSEKQRELDAKLSSELERLIFKRYPQLYMSYT
nr:hypothetical protein [Candidatus Njordarchaeota archaeon]